MLNQFYIFSQFLLRDCYVYKSRIGTYLINQGIIYPSLYAFAIGYMQSNIYFRTTDPLQGSALFIGHILIIVLVFANTLNVSLLFDLENDRYVDYQITVLSPRLVILERIIFGALFTFLISSLYFPVAKILLGPAFLTDHASWLLAYVVLFFASLCCSAYTTFTTCFIKSSVKLRSFWMRVNFALLTFGGLFIPYVVIKKFNVTLGRLVLLDPLLYITEGLRGAILADDQYISPWVCIAALLVFSIIFTLLAWHYFKKRVDHI